MFQSGPKLILFAFSGAGQTLQAALTVEPNVFRRQLFMSDKNQKLNPNRVHNLNTEKRAFEGRQQGEKPWQNFGLT